MASFEKRELKDGAVRWRAKIFVGVDAQGKRKFITSTHPTKKEAEAEARRLESAKDMNSLTLPSKQTVAEYLRDWLMNVKQDSVRDRTFAGYDSVLSRFIENPPPGAPPLGRTRMDKLTPEGIQRLYSWMRRERKLSPGSVRSLHAVLRQGLDHAVRTGALTRNPAAGGLVVLPKLEKREVKAMSLEEARRFLEAAETDRYFALWSILLNGGLRPSEAFALKWDDLDWKTGEVKIQRSLSRRAGKGWKLAPPKTPRSRRTVPLPESTIRALKEWKRSQIVERLKAGSTWTDHGFIFTTGTGEPVDGDNLITRGFREVMRRAGLGEEGPPREKPRSGPTGTPTFKPSYRMYDLRHSCATLLLLVGVNAKVVSERLGHASVAFTMDVYAASLPTLQTEATQKLQEMLG